MEKSPLTFVRVLWIDSLRKYARTRIYAKALDSFKFSATRSEGGGVNRFLVLGKSLAPIGLTIDLMKLQCGHNLEIIEKNLSDFHKILCAQYTM